MMTAQKVNYQRELDKIIARLQESGVRKRLHLHSCLRVPAAVCAGIFVAIFLYYSVLL